MKHETTNHEILLFTGTGFSSPEFCNRDEEADNSRKTSSIEALEKACSNGSFHELLPEFAASPSARSDSFI